MSIVDKVFLVLFVIVSQSLWGGIVYWLSKSIPLSIVVVVIFSVFLLFILSNMRNIRGDREEIKHNEKINIS